MTPLLLRTPEQASRWLRERVAPARGQLSTDSRRIGAGDGFIAWPGAARDGRAFVSAALAQGAAACLVDARGLAAFAAGFGLDDPARAQRIAAYDGPEGLKAASGLIAADYHGQPSQALEVLAITGTNGKTSTAWWLAQALSALRPAAPCAMIGTLGVGRVTAAAEEIVGTGLTTPDPVLLQQTLRRFVDQGVSACAIEASSIGIVERRLDGTRIHVALFTNFTQDHLDYHGSMAAYWQAKAALFDWPLLSAAVVNIDDPKGAELASALGERPDFDLWTCSLRADSPARLLATDIRVNAGGLGFQLREGAQTASLQVRTLGDYNVSNLLGVVAALRCLGYDLADAVAACGQLHPVPGRMEFQGGDAMPLAVVDYAHTPDALAQILQALRPLAAQRGGRLWCVFGCGGDRDPVKRPLMGAAAARHADRVVLTSDNPRSESPQAIIEQIRSGLPTTSGAWIEPDRALAIQHAVNEAQASDVVLVAGKGHEDYQEAAGVRRPFSDRQEVGAALRAWRERQSTPAGARA
ncbi:UDP-N-acetylmuramoylalanyl-D-glutamate--2,6-diaminopimelate ligase [Hylemonella gracilis str. Niagara R]|uniref:UDP-N-acetylmuramoyl-L-alanyl-D-glutamate--2,6-diaminopimelate ligase n=1 Tax=Hylemonella gracilis str. Niagara R TaxID=1458275 RepID=A0A016XFQ8_9BURK|nr:UDP-N-acetylmuramoyl-L-alanyl-D-glutamate--2,6-diaminopimelate ligase [Hylemonella gracilis]EYC50402.1 UDP-N-acetylmuramoylalanyl-D-glutamate--2,6-diaminopimelate ligase [Hylemonella gracilis str. Niagara R]